MSVLWAQIVLIVCKLILRMENPPIRLWVWAYTTRFCMEDRLRVFYEGWSDQSLLDKIYGTRYRREDRE